MKPRELLIDTTAFVPPAQALDGLTPEQAERHGPAPGPTHSVAEIVAHMAFWQNWFCRRLDGIHEPIVGSAALGWPEPTPGGWEDLKAHFLVGLERVAAHGGSQAGLDQPITPAIEFPPLMQLHDARRDRARLESQRLSPRPDRVAPTDDGPVAAAGRRVDLVSRRHGRTRIKPVADDTEQICHGSTRTSTDPTNQSVTDGADNTERTKKIRVDPCIP